MRFNKVCILASAFIVFCHAAVAQEISEESLGDKVRGLRAGAELRSPGSPEGKAAAEYIASFFEQAGLYPFYGGDYIEEFSSEPLVGSARKTYRNVAGIIYGSDLALDGEYVIIGAHYDYNGQQDNASGVAALLELAHSLKECAPGRNIILVAFDGFELGLLGSRHFMAQSSVPADNICLMVNLQGIGCFEGEELLSYFVRNITQPGMDYFLKLNVPYTVSVNWNGYNGRTDTEPFTLAGVPTVHITTCPGSRDEPHIDYHITKNITRLVSDAVCDITNAPFFDRPVEKEDKGPRFELGVSASAGTSFFRQSDGGGMRGKTMPSYGGGVYGQVNFWYMGLRPEVQFVHSGSRYNGGIARMNSVVVPVSLVAQSPPILPVLARIYVGGYYRRTFDGSLRGHHMDFSNVWYRNGAGLQWGIEVKFKSYGLGVNNRYGLTDMLRSGDNKMTERATYCTLSYTF